MRISRLLMVMIPCLPLSENAFAQQRTSVMIAPKVDTAAQPFRFLPPTLPANYATRCYGFFCRQELKLDKLTPLPVRFRLGSVEETDRMEGKRR